MEKKLTDSELSLFAGQLSMILHSGISVLEGVMIMRDDSPEGSGREIMDVVCQSLEETGELADALGRAEVYPEYFIRMTEIGERSGTLEEVMASLADYYDRQATLTRSIRDALTYPLVLLGMLFAVLLVLLTQVMPVFREVFEQLGIEMTGVSAMVFRVSDILQHGSVILLAVVVALAAGSLAALRTEKGRAKLVSLIRYLPLGRAVTRLLACSRFSKALSLALHSGLDMGESFELAASLTEHTEFRENVANAGRLMEEGHDLAESLRDAGMITGLNARLVSIGFKTGTAETALSQISASCQEEADMRIQSAVGILEPTLTAVLSVLTGLILVSVMLPLLSVMANIGG